MTAFAATGNRTYKASSKMTVILNPGQKGNSNTVSIRVSGLPKDAVIAKLTVNTGTMSYSGAAVCNSLTISFNATNMSTLKLGTKSYQPSITIYWDDEF